ncbi:unnamed protein product [Dovyalis caffra]|uniref:F-box associated beta-propeller type 3 domain-containing protein n=1 Tax=Dovyalis caffra TaxID=77055 RepID=A0AAV1S7T3_9ROSI|nr:unnamed protein product [Dovyalis caffra]
MERLCEDLVSGILLCLPTKSAVRFRCLSKYYDEVVSEPKFATNHALRSKPDQVQGLLRFTGRMPDKILYYSFHSKPNGSVPEVVPVNFQIMASCNGLILGVSDSDLAVCNPIVPDSVQIIPKLETPYGNSGLGLAYDPIGFSSLDFKVVHIYKRESVHLPENTDVYCFEIFDSSANSWRESKRKLFLRNSTQLQPHFYALKGQAVYLNGLLHWFRACGDILVFDVEKEETTLIGMPPILRKAWRQNQNSSWFGAADCFLYVVYVSRRQTLTWVLLDSETSKWGLVRNNIKGLSRVSHPIFFDGERLGMKCGPKKKLLRLFHLKQGEWKKIGRLPRTTIDDKATVYVPFIPTLAPLNSGDPSSTGALQILPNMKPINKKCKKRKRDSVDRKKGKKEKRKP